MFFFLNFSTFVFSASGRGCGFQSIFSATILTLRLTQGKDLFPFNLFTMETTPIHVNGINDLVHSIQTANKSFLDQAQRQVNTALTIEVLTCNKKLA